MPTLRTFTRNTDVRVDDISSPDRPDQHRLVMSDGFNYLLVEGTADSLLMLVDRINDRVHHLRSPA